ncbi:FtsX-like permease family protein [Cohnella soli]|uniref:FtsX-like permease family protein n=1 Tax=Cohnella soli TaxID=425005 RepID=A0ABW0HMK3_9BACL
MRSYGAMAGKYLKQQKKKAILTIVGIMLSVALISALGTMGQALKDNFVRQVELSDGKFELGYTKPTPALVDTLRKHMLVDKLGLISPGTSTELDNGYGIKLDAANTDAFGLLPAQLQEGRYPATPDELVAEQWILEQLPGSPKIGGTTELNAPDGKTHTYRIVGLMKNQQMTQFEGSAKAFTLLQDGASLGEQSMVVFTLKKGVKVDAHLDEFRKLNENLFENLQLLALRGESGTSIDLALSVIMGTLIGLVVLSTVAVIYNAFHIAVFERIRQFGLLRTLGASPRQIRNLVFREATVLSFIGVPLGLFIGWFGLWFALWLMKQFGLRIFMMDDFKLTFHWWIMGGSLLIGFLAVYIAAWLPARKASSVSPVDAVKGTGTIVRESFRRLRIPSLLTLIGIEGKMASTNIRRNRTKFRITTFSIVVSIMLFIVFHYFTQQLVSMTTTTNENDRIAFQLIQSFSSKQENAAKKTDDLLSADQIAKIRKLPGVAAVYGGYTNRSANAIVPDTLINADFSKKTGKSLATVDWEGRKDALLSSRIVLYDDARLKEAADYLKSGSADPQKLADEDGVLIVQTIKPVVSDGKTEIMPLTRYKVGDRIKLDLSNDGSAPVKDRVREVKVAGILEQSPFDSPYQREPGLVIIAAKTTFAKLAAVGSSEESAALATRLTRLEIALKDKADPDPIKRALSEMANPQSGIRLVDTAQSQKEERQFNLQMQIFVYGFLIIIGGIGSLNIINTIQTNLLLRRKEIGLLQAVGMTMGQIRKMAAAEGIWFGVIGGIWGIAIGYGISYLLYAKLNEVQGVPFEFPWLAALLASGTALLVGLLSVQGPLRKMEKANLLEELRVEA